MKRPAGLVIFATLFFIIGLNMMTNRSQSALNVRYIYFAVGAISLVTAWALWKNHAQAMKGYWFWVIAWLVGSGAVQFVEKTPLSQVVIWWVFSGAVWVAVGAYLKSALRRTGNLSKNL